MNLLIRIREAVDRKLLNFFLQKIKRHLSKYDDIVLYKYDREVDSLSPVIWRARSITKNTVKQKKATNNWLEDLSKLDVANKVAIDVGANHGGTASKLCQLASVVYAFEPEAKNFSNLEDQIRIRKIKNIIPLPFAVSNQSGSVDFFKRESHGIHSLGTHNKGTVVSKAQVTSTTLDEFCAEYGIHKIGLLKVDVEGFETEVFEGAKRLLDQKAIDAIVFEFSPKIHRARKMDIYAPIRTLQASNYSVYRTSGEEVSEKDLCNLSLCDLYAFPISRALI